MSLQYNRYRLHMGFSNALPPSVIAHGALPDPIVVLYAPRAALSPSQDLTPWEPGPGELYFECEFITDGAAGGTSNRHIFKSTYCQKIPLPDSRLSINMVGFEQLKVSPNPGNYRLQVTGYRSREGMDPIAIESLSSGPIEVLSKISGSRRAT